MGTDNKGRIKIKSIPDDTYKKELKKLQIELIKLQEWIKQKQLKVVVVFEGRDAAGKGGTIKRITKKMNPRICRVVALGKPTEKEATQWYFQRYVEQLPSAGEMVLFDRSWYNRAGVEKVMGFCTEDEYWEFLRSCPNFENTLIRSGIIIIKYWFAISEEEQEHRFQDRNLDPVKRWKLSPMDLKSREQYEEYSIARDIMFEYTHTPECPWYIVDADNKKRARLNCIHHLLSMIEFKDLTPDPIRLTPRKDTSGYKRPPTDKLIFVPQVY